ncbi:MAG: hypothetical protein GSR81_06055 [Desulfurococcales archaeon]|nr:hypothetical protein [Desulfurococcales archaeon]
MIRTVQESDRLKALAWLLKYAGVNTGELMKRFATRVRVQKLVYLLRDAVPEFRGYEFSLYIRGPYSPELADDYYKIINESINIDKLANSYTPPREAVALLDELVDINDLRLLELAATILDVYKAYKRNPIVELTLDRLIRHLKIIKPWANREQILRALELLRQLGFIDFD